MMLSSRETRNKKRNKAIHDPSSAIRHEQQDCMNIQQVYLHPSTIKKHRLQHHMSKSTVGLHPRECGSAFEFNALDFIHQHTIIWGLTSKLISPLLTWRRRPSSTEHLVVTSTNDQNSMQAASFGLPT
jgi:hypothetical protein